MTTLYSDANISEGRCRCETEICILNYDFVLAQKVIVKHFHSTITEDILWRFSEITMLKLYISFKIHTFLVFILI